MVITKETIEKRRKSRSWYKHHSKETKEKIRKALTGKVRPKEVREKISKTRLKRKICPKGGRRKAPRGYILILKPEHPFRNNHDCVFEHRLVMEKKLGRYLTKDEWVHHKNGVPNDNRIENLQIVNKKGSHFGEIICPFCNMKFAIR